MSYFRRCADYYMKMLQLSGEENRADLAERCRAKYPRGVNLVAVDQKAIGDTFMPNFFVDPGRIFLTYERFMKEALYPLPDEKDAFYKETNFFVIFESSPVAFLWIKFNDL